MADIFLSYARADQARVEKLAAALEEAGYTLWWDKHLRGGHQFSEDIEAAIAKAKAVLVVWSKDAVKSEWVRDEAAYGRDQNKLVPVRIDDTLPPMGYRQRHAIDLSKGDADAMAALTDALDSLVGGTHEAPPPTPAATTRGNRPLFILLAIMALLAVGAVGWFSFGRAGPGDAAAEASQQASVAVMPFVARSSGPDDRFLADGLSEELINRLSALPDLRVSARSSSFYYRDNPAPMKEIAAQLGVDHIVEGSVTRAGDKVRVNASLIRADDGTTLWSHSYDTVFSDILTVQADITEQVAAALDVLLDPAKRERMAAVGVEDPEAFVALAKGREISREVHDQQRFAELARANAEFDRAFALSPNLWRAMVESTDHYIHQLLDHASGDQRSVGVDIEAARRELDRRLALASAAQTQTPRFESPAYMAVLFSDDWTGLPAIADRMMAERRICQDILWAELYAFNFGHAAQFADYTRHMDKCDPVLVDSDPVFPLSYLLAGDPQAAYDRAGPSTRTRFLAALALGNLDAARTSFATMPRGVRQTVISEAELAMREGRSVDEAALLARFDGPPNDIDRLSIAAVVGNRAEANRLAALIDARPTGPVSLLIVPFQCLCGIPFDLSVTPNLEKRIAETGLRWQPPDLRASLIAGKKKQAGG